MMRVITIPGTDLAVGFTADAVLLVHDGHLLPLHPEDWAQIVQHARRLRAVATPGYLTVDGAPIAPLTPEDDPREHLGIFRLHDAHDAQ